MKYTARPRKKISAPMRWLVDNGHIRANTKCLDFGSGRGFDAQALGMDAYDPEWGPFSYQHGYDIITCHYVLNILDDKQMIEAVHNITSALNHLGTAFVSVRRDIPRRGAKGLGCRQRYVTLPFHLLVENSNFAIYTWIKV